MAARTKTKVSSKYKTKNRVKNWPAYDFALRERGDLTVWLDEERYCQMLWMARERIRRFQAASFISPSMNGTPSMTWVMSL